MKISLSYIIDGILDLIPLNKNQETNLNNLILNQIYLLESGFGDSNNIEKIVGETFSQEENFDELNDLLFKIKGHKITEKAILQISHLRDFYYFSKNQKEKITNIFSELDIFCHKTKPTDDLSIYKNIIHEPQDRLKKYGYLNYFTQSLHNNYLDLLYKQENLDDYMSQFNQVISAIYEKIKKENEDVSNHVTNIIMIGMNVKNLFEILVNELIAHNNSQSIIQTKTIFPILFSQLPLYYLDYQNNTILAALQNIELSKLNSEDEQKIKKWIELFLLLQKKLEDTSAIGGICKILNAEGIEVEDLNHWYRKFIQIIQLRIVEIVEIKKHPNSDRLNLCTVFDGHEKKEVVCGASNVHKIKDNNLRTILARTGQTIPNGMILEPREIRGIISDGMLCSLEELSCDFLDKDDSGITEMDSNSILGLSPFLKIIDKFNFSDIADISITPNLGYSLGLYNIIEIIQSYISKSYFHFQSEITESIKRNDEKNIFDIAKNPLIYCDDEIINSTVIENIFYFKYDSTNYKQYDLYFKNLLMSHDFEIHGDIRDYMNYMQIIFGFRFHAIDLDKIKGEKLQIIFNQEEKDGLKIGDIVVIDEEKNIVAIPGIYDIEKYKAQSNDAKNILFFTFFFHDEKKSDPNFGFNKMLQIARRNKISNDMIYFFERSRINAATLFLLNAFIGDGEENEKVKYFYTNNKINTENYFFKNVQFDIFDAINLFKKNGVLSKITTKNFDMNIIGTYCHKILMQLGIADIQTYDEIIDGSILNLKIFKTRKEINASMDIVAALYKYFTYQDGLDDFYNGFYKKFVDEDSNSDNEKYFQYNDFYNQEIDSRSFGDYEKLLLQQKICKTLVARGYNELCNFSFIDKNSAYFDEKFLVKLSSPVNKNLNVLRSSIFSSLLENLQEIAKTSQDNIAIFEVGPVYTSYNIFQKNISGMKFGDKFPRNIHSKEKSDFNFYDIKADFLLSLREFNIEEEDLQFYRLDNFYDKDELLDIMQEKKLIHIFDGEIYDANKQFFHEGKSAIAFSGNHPIGYLGEIHPKILQDLEFRHNVVGFTIFCESLNLIGKQNKKPMFQSQYQAVHRDFALIFDANEAISDIKNTIRNTNFEDENILRDISIFDIYQDEKLKSQNKKSIGISLKIQSHKQTLSDKIISDVVKNILDKLKEQFNSYMLFEENK